MAKYFLRRYRIEIFDENNNSLRVLDSKDEADPLQIEFGVETSFGAALSMMELSIYGLKRESIQRILLARKISFQAGYKDSIGVIFEGRITNVVSPRRGVERITTLYCWSGLKEQKDKTCAVSFGPGTKYESIVDFIARDIFGRPAEYIGFDSLYRASMGTALGGYSEEGPHKVLLDRLSRNLGFQWMIENERCILMARGASRDGAAYPINVETGLVGGISLNEIGCDFEMLLNPKIRVGDKVQIDSDSSTINFSGIYSVRLPENKTRVGDGLYVVKALRRRGDFYSDNGWVNALTCWRDGETGLKAEGLQYAQ